MVMMMVEFFGSIRDVALVQGSESKREWNKNKNQIKKHMRDLTTQPYPVNVWAVCTCVSLPDKITEKRAKVVQPTTAAKDQKQDREFLGRGETAFSIQHQHQGIKIGREQLFQKVDGTYIVGICDRE